MSILLGAIADDFTGATDLANTLVKEGMRAVQVIGVPDADLDFGDANAVIVALKSRTEPPAEAIEDSLAALAWLKARGTRQFFFKYCSTFDSTDAGNIGPVAEALMEALDTDFTIACPAFPANGRTLFNGHLFVGDVLLSDSGMKNHPLTPMTDANLVRVLARQTKKPVGLVPYAAVDGGAESIRSAYSNLKAGGFAHAIVDAISDPHLRFIGEASADLKLITGGSGVALGLPENFRKQGLLQASATTDFHAPPGRTAIIAGSCSQATRGQIAHAQKHIASFLIDPMELAAGQDKVAEALAWARAQNAELPILIYSSADPELVKQVQEKLGREKAGAMVEDALARVALGLYEQGVRRLVVAGGETSGAVVNALQVPALRIGPEIDPGVPWTETMGPKKLALALKSGNFGTQDFFLKSFAMLS
ncbi:MAG: four-carbon acid sugar kinase family protein [Rhodospirillales bacterium]|nr:four-carbon acid sugar kinase family protein [Rhodospirillales bacterium]